jgi:hypothetical protein
MDNGVVRLNPEAEALLGFTAAVDSFTNSMIKLGHILASKDVDADFKHDVKGSAHLICERFNQEITQTLTVVVAPEKRGQ